MRRYLVNPARSGLSITPLRKSFKNRFGVIDINKNKLFHFYKFNKANAHNFDYQSLECFSFHILWFK